MSTLEAVLLVIVIAIPVVFMLRWIQLRNRGPNWGVIVGGTPPVAEAKFSCTGTSRGNVHGMCADGWWDRIWNGYPWCDDIKFWCELAGGKFEKK